MRSDSLTIGQVLALLAETPTRITTLTAGLTPAQAHVAPSQGAWSVHDVLAHLRSCADVWGAAMATIIAEDTPTIRAINPTTWITQTNYPEGAFQPSFRAFVTQRAELLAVLEPLPQDGWSRSATVTGAGKPLERTVLFYAQWLARHERQHVKQIERIVNTVRGEQQPPRS